jgi:hypothetical protein
MKAAAAKKKVSIPTLQERVEGLLVELDDALDELAAERKAYAEKHGPEGGGGAMPQSSLRRMIDAKGFGDCPCRSYLAAMKENN